MKWLTSGLMILALCATVHAETRGNGPFVAKANKAKDGSYYLVQGIRPFALALPDQTLVAPHEGTFIRFECESDQVGAAYSGLTNLNIVDYRDKDFCNADPATLSVRLEMDASAHTYPDPIHFAFVLYHKRKGPNPWGFGTRYMRAGIWSVGDGAPRLIRDFPINREWGIGYDDLSIYDVFPDKPKRVKRSINVLLTPGSYSLVVQEIRTQLDGKEIPTLIADPLEFTAVANSNQEEVATGLLKWVKSGPVSERVRVAREMVSLGASDEVHNCVLDDLNTGLFQRDGEEGQAIQFVAQRPAKETARVLRSVLLRSSTEGEIPYVLSAIYDGRSKHPLYTELLLSVLQDQRYVKAGPNLCSQLRVCDCVAAYLASSDRSWGSSYFKGKTVPERDDVIEKAIQDLRNQKQK